MGEQYSEDPSPDHTRTTQLLNLLGAGDRSVEDELLGRIRVELQRLAGACMSGLRPGHTLQPTALVHEAWLKLIDRDDLQFEGRRSFFKFASRVMRSVLVDHARASGARKRGGDRNRVSLSLLPPTGDDHGSDEQAIDVLDLDAALRELEVREPELVRIVELRFFGGLTNQDIATELGRSLRTIERQWRFARAWLRTRLEGEATGE